MQNRIIVIGQHGQVGRALAQTLGNQAKVFGRSDLDLSNPHQLEKNLDSLLDSLSEAEKPKAFINAAAYTQVDRAEQEPALAEAINAEAPAVLAQWCARQEIPFIHYSTDYVFPGTGEHPWTEKDPTSPLNTYGASKLRGEKAIAAQMKSTGKWLIFRTSWVYDATGKNFLNTMLRLGQEREELKIVADQFGAPTYAPHLAQATLKALEHASQQEIFPSGVYHLCHSGVTSWHGFTQKIFEEVRKRGLPGGASLRVQKILPILSEEYPTPARRPKNSRMNTDLAFERLGVRLPDWQQGLEDCINLICVSKPNSATRP